MKLGYNNLRYWDFDLGRHSQHKSGNIKINLRTELRTCTVILKTCNLLYKRVTFKTNNNG